MTNFLLKFALLLLLLSTIPAKAQDAEPFQGIFCDTQAQIERVATLGPQLGGAWEGIQAVNKEVGGNNNACIHATIVGVRKTVVGHIQTPEGRLAVVPFEVKAVATPFGLIERAEPTVWFTLADPVGQEV